VPERILHEYNGTGFRFGLPEDVKWQDYFSRERFSYLTPQFALALMEEHRSRFAGADHETTRTKENHSGIPVQDSFGKRLTLEIWNDLSQRKVYGALRGFFILSRYKARKFTYTQREEWAIRKAKTRNKLSNLILHLKRFLLRKPIGTIIAEPNPIPVCDYSGTGKTTVKWRSLGAKQVEIRMNAPDGQIFERCESSGSKTTDKWVCDGLTFYLQDVSNGLPLTPENTLSKVVVKLIIRQITI
jgi:hypothetical protein